MRCLVKIILFLNFRSNVRKTHLVQPYLFQNLKLWCLTLYYGEIYFKWATLLSGTFKMLTTILKQNLIFNGLKNFKSYANNKSNVNKATLEHLKK